MTELNGFTPASNGNTPLPAGDADYQDALNKYEGRYAYFQRHAADHADREVLPPTQAEAALEAARDHLFDTHFQPLGIREQYDRVMTFLAPETETPHDEVDKRIAGARALFLREVNVALFNGSYPMWCDETIREFEWIGSNLEGGQAIRQQASDITQALYLIGYHKCQGSASLERAIQAAKDWQSRQPRLQGIGQEPS